MMMMMMTKKLVLMVVVVEEGENNICSSPSLTLDDPCLNREPNRIPNPSSESLPPSISVPSQLLLPVAVSLLPSSLSSCGCDCGRFLAVMMAALSISDCLRSDDSGEERRALEVSTRCDRVGKFTTGFTALPATVPVVIVAAVGIILLEGVPGLLVGVLLGVVLVVAFGGVLCGGGWGWVDFPPREDTTG